MTISATTCRYSLALALALAATTPVRAETAPSTPADAAAEPSQDELVVTASRRAEAIQAVPVTLTAASGAFLEKLELRTAIDTARIAPNANAWGTESRQRPRWFIRGIGSNDVSSNVISPIAVYNDEVYLNHFSLQGFPLFDLDRVEILRGPAGTLWGKNTTGGALSFVSAKPNAKTEAYARLTVGDFNQQRLEAALGGAVADQLSARASFLYDHRDGFATNDFTGNTAGKVKDIAGRLQLKYDPTAQTSILLSAHVRDYAGGTNPVLTIGTNPNGTDSFGYATPVDRYHVNYNVDGVNKIHSFGGLINATHDLGFATLTSITSYDRAKRSDLSDGDNTPNELSRGYARTNVHQLSEEVRLTSPDHGRFRWIVGAYYFHDDLKSFAATATLPSPLNRPLAYYDTAYEQKTTSLAAFANASFDITDRLRIGGGLRFTHDRLSIDLLSQQATAPIAFTDTVNWFEPTSVNARFTTFATQIDTRNWSALGYEVKPEWRPLTGVLVYARFAKGYRSGNFQGNIAPPATLPNVVQPEKVYSYEGGIKTTIIDRKLTFNATVFYYDYKNIQTTLTTLLPATPTTPAGTISQIRDAQGWVEGAEFEVTATPIENLRLIGNLGLLKTRYTDLVNAGVRIVGNEFARAPHRTAFVSGEYRIPFGGNALILGTDWRYNSLFRLNAITQNNDQFDVQAYWVGNARATVELKDGRYAATVFVNNAADTQYKIHTLPASNGSYKRYLGDPRTWGVTLSARL